MEKFTSNSIKTFDKICSTTAAIGEVTGAILGAVAIAFPPVAIGAAIATCIATAANIGHKIIEHKEQ